MTQAFRAREAGAANTAEEHRAFLEPTPKRIRAVFAGETIADTTSAVIMHETRHQPVYYLPTRDVRWEFLEETAHSSR